MPDRGSSPTTMRWASPCSRTSAPASRWRTSSSETIRRQPPKDSVALAKAVGRMHADTLGRQDSFYARLPGHGTSLEDDRVSLANTDLATWWSALRAVAARHPALPARYQPRRRGHRSGDRLDG